MAQGVLSTITQFAEFITALLIIVQAFTKYNPLDKVKHWLFKEQEQKISEINVKVDCLTRNNKEEHKKLNEKYNKLHRDQLKANIMNERIPLPERVKQGDYYINVLHGNGEVSVQYSLLKKRYEEELEKRRKENE